MKFLDTYTKSIEQELSNVEFPDAPQNLYNPLRYFLEIGGKRIRPILTLMGAELFGLKSHVVINQAVSVELFHNFSLIHDDIMDEAPLRRGKETIHQKWNQNIGILSGDVLLIRAYQSLSSGADNHLADLLTVFNNTAIEVCEGQQMDMDFEDRSDVSIQEYIEMIRLKTSVLLGCALEFGAIMANASEIDRRNLYNFGQLIGVAFQIQDDILDIEGDAELAGKRLQKDVSAGKATFVSLLGIEDARLRAKELIEEAIDALSDYGVKAEPMRQVAKFIIERKM